MSGESFPILASIFADAIKELPLSTVHAKAAELRNSIAHLRRSNDELKSFVAESCESESDKTELEGYIAENRGVISSMEERIALLKAEVEGRGQLWIEPDTGTRDATDADHESSTAVNGARNDGADVEGSGGASQGTQASDSNQQARDTTQGREEDGVYL